MSLSGAGPTLSMNALTLPPTRNAMLAPSVSSYSRIDTPSSCTMTAMIGAVLAAPATGSVGNDTENSEPLAGFFFLLAKGWSRVRLADGSAMGLAGGHGANCRATSAAISFRMA